MQIGEIKKTQKYLGFTMVEMLITMMILALIFLAIGSVVVNMLKASNLVSSRMLIREEGEYLSEVFRKYIRNSSADNVKLYHRSEPTIRFSEYEVVAISGNPIPPSDVELATEIHFRPSGDSTGKVICIGFFKDAQDDDEKGYITRSVGFLEDRSWDNYSPEWCFPSDPSQSQSFRQNFVTLNSDLIYIQNLEIRREGLDALTGERTSSNVYYSVDLDMKPYWGVGGLSNYRSLDGAPTYRKSFVVQTRQLYYW